MKGQGWGPVEGVNVREVIEPDHAGLLHGAELGFILSWQASGRSYTR